MLRDTSLEVDSAPLAFPSIGPWHAYVQERTLPVSHDHQEEFSSDVPSFRHKLVLLTRPSGLEEATEAKEVADLRRIPKSLPFAKILEP